MVFLNLMIRKELLKNICIVVKLRNIDIYCTVLQNKVY